MSARQRRNQPGNAVQESTNAAYGGNRIYANCTINGGSLVKFMVDTGADVTILSEGSANAVKFDRTGAAGSLTLNGVAGSSQAPLYNVRLRIESQPAIQATIAVAKTNFNLLAIRDISKVFNINITSTGTKLVPKAVAAPAMIPIPEAEPQPVPVVPVPTLDLSPDQIKIGIMLFVVLVALSSVG